MKADLTDFYIGIGWTIFIFLVGVAVGHTLHFYL
jgi:hypothetical protein